MSDSEDTPVLTDITPDQASPDPFRVPYDLKPLDTRRKIDAAPRGHRVRPSRAKP